MKTPKEPWGFCETPEEKCTMNYCDDNGCQNRKRALVSEPQKLETLYRKIEDLDLSIRTKNLLRNAGINTLQELTSYTKSDLLKFRNFGRSSLIELDDLMLKNNLSFGTVGKSLIKSDTKILQNALAQIEKLEADKEELLEALVYANRMLNIAKDSMYDKQYIESLIQKHKQ